MKQLRWAPFIHNYICITNTTRMVVEVRETFVQSAQGDQVNRVGDVAEVLS